MIKKSLYLISLPLTLTLLLSGCGSSGGSTKKSSEVSSTNTDGTSKTQILSAKFNAKSSGVTYECGSQKGTLKDDGTFKFEKGKECVFYDGSTVIQKVATSQLKEGSSIDEKAEEKKTVADTPPSELAKLLMGKTYYAVQPKDTKIITLEFEEKQDSDNNLYVWASLDGASLNSTYQVKDNTLFIPSRNLTFQFIKKEADYLLFDSERRMYISKENAKAFVDANK